MSNAEKKNRFEYLDILEFIAIFLVISCHGTTYNFDFIKESAPIYYVRYFLRSLASASVPLFFFINGYLLFNRELNLKKHLYKTLRLAVLTVIWAIISVLVMMPIQHEAMTVKGFLVRVWGMSDNWLWYMGTLVGIYILFPILKSTYDYSEKCFRYFVIICAVMTFGNRLICNVMTVAAHSLINYPNVIKMNVFNAFNPFQGIYWYDFVYFCGGGLIYKYIPRIMEKLKKLTVISAIALPISMALLTLWGVYVSRLNAEVWDNTWGGFDTIFTPVMVLAMFIISLNYNPQNKTIKKTVETVSKNTLGLYLIHELYILPTVEFVRGIDIARNIPGDILYTICIVSVCMATIWLIKKIPVVKKLLV